MALTNEFGFTIGGYHSENFNIRVYDIHRNILPELTENLLNIPARKGAYFTGLTVAHRIIQVDIRIVANSHADRIEYIKEIAYWLLSNADSDQEICFDDDTSVVYYGHIANSTQVVRSLFSGTATIEFHCSDPFAYSTTDMDIAADSTGLFTFDNSGSADIYPIFTTEFANDSAFLSIISPNGTILVGTPPDGTLTNTPATTTIFNDDMLDATSWADAGQSALDPGHTDTGTISQLSSGIGVSSFGTGTSWHGPAVRRNLPSTVQDFTVYADVQLGSQNTTSSWDGTQMGSIEIYLYDSNNVKIGKLQIADATSGYEYNEPRMEFSDGSNFLLATAPLPAPKKISQKEYTYYTVKKGDTLSAIAKANKVSLSDLCSINGFSTSHVIHVGDKIKVKSTTTTKTVYPENTGHYNDFQGRLTLQRIGTTWYAEVKRTDSAKNQYLLKATYYDTKKKYSQSAISYIVINMLAHGTSTPCKTMEVDNIKVIKHNTIDPTQSNTTIFQAGDELIIDCTDSSVTLNGKLIMDQLDIGSVFFPIEPGTTQVKVLTDGTGATHSATYTPRFL